MAGLDVAAAAIGIASFGIQVCQGLLSYFDDLKGYKSDIVNVHSAVTDVSGSLALLKEALEKHGLDKKKAQQVADRLKSCEDALSRLSDRANELKSQNNPTGLRQKTHAKLQQAWYPFRKETLVNLQETANDVREHLQFVLHILQLDLQLDMKQQMNAIQQSDRWRSIANWISPSDPWTNHRSARKDHEAQTGTWLLDSSQYRSWKAGSVKHVWIHGDPGCGKTILCSTAIEDMLIPANVTVAVFYFSFSDERKRTYEDLIRSLLVQIGWKEPALSLLQETYDQPHRNSLSSDELEAMLLKAIESHGDVFLFLDALDECAQDITSRGHVLENMNSLADRASGLHMFATSRPLTDIGSSMETLNACQVSVDPRKVDADIQRYVAGELERNKTLKLWKPETKKMIQKKIGQKARGSFRWAFCQLRELQNLQSSRPRHIQAVLDSLPATLDETYIRMLRSIGKVVREDALTLLRWLAYARSPPTLNQLVEAVIVEPSKNLVYPDERGGLYDVLRILPGMVTILRPDRTENSDGAKNSDVEPTGGDHSSDNGQDTSDDDPNSFTADTQVRLAHFSIKEFLESDRILNTDVQSFHLDCNREHRFLTQSCLTYLIHYSESNEKTSTEEDLEMFPLAEYAAKSWFHHSKFNQDADVTREAEFLHCAEYRIDCLQLHDPDGPSIGNQFRTIVRFDPRVGISCLYYAVIAGLGGVARRLLDMGANINEIGGRRGTALAAAASQGNIDIVKLLLEQGAETNGIVQGDRYRTALSAASLMGHVEIVKLLLEQGAEINAEGGEGTALSAASSMGEIETVKLLLERGVEINLQGGEYGTALSAASASYWGTIEIVKLLLERGADVHARNNEQKNAIEIAEERGATEIAELLRKHVERNNAQPET